MRLIAYLLTVSFVLFYACQLQFNVDEQLNEGYSTSEGSNMAIPGYLEEIESSNDIKLLIKNMMETAAYEYYIRSYHKLVSQNLVYPEMSSQDEIKAYLTVLEQNLKAALEENDMITVSSLLGYSSFTEYSIQEKIVDEKFDYLTQLFPTYETLPLSHQLFVKSQLHHAGSNFYDSGGFACEEALCNALFDDCFDAAATRFNNEYRFCNTIQSPTIKASCIRQAQDRLQTDLRTCDILYIWCYQFCA